MPWKSDVVGNMIGNVGPGTLTWWIGLRGQNTGKSALPEHVVVRPKNAYVDVWPSGSPAAVTRYHFGQLPLVRCGTGATKHLAYQGWTATANDLVPGTSYTYRIVADGKRAGADRGLTVPFDSGTISVSVPLPAAAPAPFTAVFSSCQRAKYYKASGVDTVQSAWGQVPKQVALNIMVGDTHYANSHTRSKKWEYSIAQFRVAAYRSVISRIPSYAIYDDHDFIDNNVEGDTAEGKKVTAYGPVRERASRYFDGLWIIPATPGRDRNTGCYHSFWHRGVLFVMLDTLYYRQAPGKGDMLGVKQWAWLEDVLAAAPAGTIKVICSGPTLEDGSNGWDWSSYPVAAKRLMDVVSAAPGGAARTVVVSGDIHEVRFKTAASQAGLVKLPELISSGIGLDPNDNAKYGGFATMSFDPTAGTATYTLTNGQSSPATGAVF